VRRSPISGSGLFAADRLPARRKLGELSGNRVTLPEAWRAAEDAAGIDTARIDLEQVSARRALDCSGGNALRRLNHSCTANGYLRVIDRRVEVYTRHAIAPGSQRTVDYGQTPHRRGMRCHCGDASCRGII
jgi:SET domain-containing protein